MSDTVSGGDTDLRQNAEQEVPGNDGPSGKNGQDEDQREELLLDYCKNMLPYIASYHDHKENMAHTAFALLVAVVMAVVGFAHAVEDVSRIHVVLVGMVFPFIGLLNWYIRWEMVRRRDAAIRGTAFQKWYTQHNTRRLRTTADAMMKTASTGTGPVEQEADAANPEGASAVEPIPADNRAVARLVSVLGRAWAAVRELANGVIVPISTARLPMDAEIEECPYPEPIQRLIEEQRLKATANGLVHERMLFLGVVGMALVVAAVLIWLVVPQA